MIKSCICFHLRLIVVQFLSLFVFGPLFIQAQTNMAFRDADLPIDRREEDLISRLTVSEKIGQTMMASPAISRLGIKSYDWWNEALHGVARNGIATVFPQAIALAATWNTALHEHIAELISTEARAKHNEAIIKNGGYTKRYQGLTIWSPNINIFRDPRWGCGQETYGEDPFLTSRMGVAFVRGLQGQDPQYLKTVATVKHYAVHSGPEKTRHAFNAVVSERDLRETYLPAFEACIREGGANSIMSAYNSVNGIPVSASKSLLKDILPDEWGFKGAVVGDVDTVADLWRKGGHRYSESAAGASATAIRVGNDLCSGTTFEALDEALKLGLVSEADIDVALRRLLTLRFRIGEFDPIQRVAFRSIPGSANNTPENSKVALEAARQSLVLLKNDGMLPWNPKSQKTVAIIGPSGADYLAMLGNYSGVPSRKISLVEGIREKFEPLGIKVIAEPGSALAKGFHENGRPFPEGVLFTDKSRTLAGLLGLVIKNKQTLATRTDLQIDLQWDQAQPVEGIPIKNASLTWSGIMVAPATGEYLLGVIAEGKVRASIDDKEVMSAWNNVTKYRSRRQLNTPIKLEKAQVYNLQVEYEQDFDSGSIQFGWIAPGQDDSLEKALKAARAADHIVLTLGITPALEGEAMRVSAEGLDSGDRTNINLPAIQVQLLEKIAALNKPTAIVLTTGSAINLDDTKANAVLLVWYYGQRGAEAVAETLLGENNPAGRLPVTFYKSVNDLPPFADYNMANRTYRYYTGKPLYAFGHGLSYTTFGYGELKASELNPKSDSVVNITVSVTNTGKIAGDEVVQLYVRALNPNLVMAQQWLVGFSRVALQAGETQSTVIPVKMESLRYWDESHSRYMVKPGKYELIAATASDQPNSRLSLNISSH